MGWGRETPTQLTTLAGRERDKEAGCPKIRQRETETKKQIERETERQRDDEPEAGRHKAGNTLKEIQIVIILIQDCSKIRMGKRRERNGFPPCDAQAELYRMSLESRKLELQRVLFPPSPEHMFRPSNSLIVLGIEDMVCCVTHPKTNFPELVFRLRHILLFGLFRLIRMPRTEIKPFRGTVGPSLIHVSPEGVCLVVFALSVGLYVTLSPK